MTDRRTSLQQARLYLVVSPEALGVGWETSVAIAMQSGAVDVLQLRAKTWADDQILSVARALRAACHAAGALFVLNDRPDLAREADADGVHVGDADASLAQARAHVGADRLVGCSTHDAQELAAARAADYAGLGPCFATGSKTLTRSPGGAALLASALPAAPAGLPVFPIGGIDATTLPLLTAAGAIRAAVGAGVLAQPDPARAAHALRALLRDTTDTRGALGSTPR